MMMAGYNAISKLKPERISDHITRRLITGERGMITWWDMKAGAHAAAHSHPHEQITWLLSGRMEFRLGQERFMCKPGDLVVIPGGTEHEAWFPDDSEVCDVFTPPREDFLAGGTPTYMATADA